MTEQRPNKATGFAVAFTAALIVLILAKAIEAAIIGAFS